MRFRDVVLDAITFKRPAYVPWSWNMTQQCRDRVVAELGAEAAASLTGPAHIVRLGSAVGKFTPIGANLYRDIYGVVWDRSVDKDIGTPSDWPIKTPEDLDRYTWPNPDDDAWYAGHAQKLSANRDLFSIYNIGFSLYERAWTMRGMVSLLMDMIERPDFVAELLRRITEHNLIQIRRALALGVDAVYFGDDYGSQVGLIMGIEHWRHFIKPCLRRMFEPVRSAGKVVFMHSCGCVASLFDDLVEIGLNVFNPFQPEVMDIFAVKRAYHGRLAFHGGMSVQKILPFGTADEVRQATGRLIDAGREGGLIFSPSHDVPYDVPPANLVAMMEVLRAQPGAPKG